MTPYYEHDGITLYHGDCQDVLPGLDSSSSIDLILTDPPYGMNWNTDSRRFTGGKGSHFATGLRIQGDQKKFDPSPWLDFPRVVLWGSNHFANLLPVGTTLVWQKKSADKFGAILSDAEIAWEKGGHGVYLFRCIWDGCARESENQEHYHPSQKPVALMQWCIARAGLRDSAMLLDPFCGSGTTLRAAKDAGLRAIGIEIEERYAEIAARRLEQGVLKYEDGPRKEACYSGGLLEKMEGQESALR